MVRDLYYVYGSETVKVAIIRKLFIIKRIYIISLEIYDYKNDKNRFNYRILRIR